MASSVTDITFSPASPAFTGTVAAGTTISQVTGVTTSPLSQFAGALTLSGSALFSLASAGATAGTSFDDEFAAFVTHQLYQTGDKWAWNSMNYQNGDSGPQGSGTGGPSGDQYWTNPQNPNSPCPGLV